MPTPLRNAVLALLVVPVLAAPAHARESEVVPGQYIVVYDESAGSVDRETDERERRDGFRSRLRYGQAIKGFSARLSRSQVERLQADADVAAVVADRRVRATGALAAGESVPTGVDRIEAAGGGSARGASAVNVAVIDTGVDLDHPDLSVTAGRNCVGTTAPDDDNGHGTHVAGSIAALNSGAGVLGVAPGTRIFAAKVLDGSGSGTTSQVICGIDWVTATRTDDDPSNDIAVANMSLGGGGTPIATCATTTDPQHQAICRSVAAGVTYVVAAGNDGWDFDYASVPDTPAAYPEVLTVTAVTDSDGASGGSGGAPACRTGETDDLYASYSNFASTSAGAAHTIAGPGTCIRSTWPGGGYETISGTSMATPHLAGAVALCLDEGGAAGPCAGLTPAQIVSKMRSDADAINRAAPSYGFTGDPLHSPVSGRYYGFLAHAGTTAPTAPEPTAVSTAPSGTAIIAGSLSSGSASSLAADDAAYLTVSSTKKRTRTSDWYGRFTSVPSTLSDLKISYRGRNSSACSQTVSILRWTDSRWVTLDSRTVGTTETGFSGQPVSGTQSSYVSSTGELRVRVRCTSSTSFSASGNLMRIDYTRP